MEWKLFYSVSQNSLIRLKQYIEAYGFYCAEIVYFGGNSWTMKAQISINHLELNQKIDDWKRGLYD